MRTIALVIAVTLVLGGLSCGIGPAGGSTATGGGVYEVLPDTPSDFLFSEKFVQCNVPPVSLPKDFVLPSGFVVPFDLSFEMYMSSTKVDSSVIDGGTVTISGTLVSLSILTPDDGSEPIRLVEKVPFTAVGEDNAPANQNDGTDGSDFFSLMVPYTSTADLDQADLFTEEATFSGFVKEGDVVVQ